jgi:hypothetical protein
VNGAAPASAVELLSGITPDQLLTVSVASYPYAATMLAGLWLWHDGLDECHEIAQTEPQNLQAYAMQSMENDQGENQQQFRNVAVSLAFWHAVMHRREGDFSNAKYWYARCTNHPVLQTMAPFVNDILHPLPADKSFLRLTQSGWNPSAFVDLCEQLHNRPSDPRHPVAVVLQKLEWRLLFDHCTRAASGQ